MPNGEHGLQRERAERLRERGQRDGGVMRGERGDVFTKKTDAMRGQTNVTIRHSTQ